VAMKGAHAGLMFVDSNVGWIVHHGDEQIKYGNVLLHSSSLILNKS